jgi:hypothetical protein
VGPKKKTIVGLLVFNPLWFIHIPATRKEKKQRRPCFLLSYLHPNITNSCIGKVRHTERKMVKREETEKALRLTTEKNVVFCIYLVPASG